MPAFTEILNLSICAGILVLAVLAARMLFLRNAPKAMRCGLWALVAIRLLCPFSIESSLSLMPSREVIPEQYLSMEPVEYNAPARLELVTNPVYEDPITVETETTVDRLQSWDVLASVVWLTGMGAMAIYAAYSYLSLRLRVRMAGWVRDNIYECDNLDTPFILGLILPRIYLPSDLDEITRSHVLAHEKAHLKRLDHIWKPLGFVLLAVHWFNPLLWLAYVLLCRDIELACDEKVVRSLKKTEVRAYSESLVRCSVTRRSIAMCPLAFGEVGVKGRIRSILHYKKPAFWVLLAAVVCTAVLALCFLTDPVKEPATIDQILNQDGYTVTAERICDITLELDKNDLPENVLDGREHLFEPEQISVWRSGNTVIWLSSARMRGDGLSLAFAYSHTLPEAGTVYLPRSVLEPGDLLDLESRSGGVRTGSEFYPGTCHVYTNGGSSFAMHIDMELYNQLTGTFYLDLTNCWQVSYRSDALPAVTNDALLDAIVSENGYTHTNSGALSLAMMFYIDWLPEECFEPEGYEFRAGELTVIDTGTSYLDVTKIAPAGDQLRFDFLFRYHLPESGTILLPYQITDSGPYWNLRLNGQLYDFSRDHAGGVELFPEFEGEAFSLLIDRTLIDNADDYLSIGLDNFCELTYVPAGTNIHGRSLHVEQTLYRHSEYTLDGTAAHAPDYLVGNDLHLTALEEGLRWQIRRELGTLEQTELTKENFDDLFISRHKTAAFSPKKLRENTTNAWLCPGHTGSRLLLQQKDGTLYLAVMQQDVLTDLYRLSAADLSGDLPQPVLRSYAMELPGSLYTPQFTLSTDGTFHFTTSLASSYFAYGSYTLEDDALTMQTRDGLYTWIFVPDGDGFRYDAARSTPISFLSDPKTPMTVPDSTLFD